MTEPENDWITIGQLSKRTECNIETIRYYERIGILPEPPRSSGGRRLFTSKHVRRLMFIRRSRALGFRLEEVRGLLRMVDGGQYTCKEVEELTTEHIRDVKAKIRDLNKMKRVLESMASRCAGGVVPECPIIEVLFGDGGENT